MGVYRVMPPLHHTVHPVMGTHDSCPMCVVFFNDEAVYVGTREQCTAYVNTREPAPMCWVVMKPHYVEEAEVTAEVFADFNRRMGM